MVSKALSCITSRLDSISHTYATALVTYTLMLANNSNASKMMRLLRNRAVTTGKIKISSRPSWLDYSYYFIVSIGIEYINVLNK